MFNLDRLPTSNTLRAFSEQMLEGLILFREDGELVMANAVAREGLSRAPDADGRVFGERCRSCCRPTR